VHVITWPETEHAQPFPEAAAGFSPAGIGSVTVTVPLVGVSPSLVTVSVKLPVLARRIVAALAVLEIARLGPDCVFTVTEPVADVVSPPPLTLAEFVTDAATFEPTLTDTEIAG
jgi:hypothetical protein